jgi:hypothetical protein
MEISKYFHNNYFSIKMPGIKSCVSAIMHNVWIATRPIMFLFIWDLILVITFSFYVFFWVIPRHLNFMCQCFRTLCLFHLHRPMKIEETECSETLGYKIQTPGNWPEEGIQHSEHGKSLKSRIHFHYPFVANLQILYLWYILIVQLCT